MAFLSHKFAVERIVSLILLPVVGLAIYAAEQLAVADHYFTLNTPESLENAVRVEPDNAEYHQMLAEHRESIGKDAGPEREKAALLSPLQSRYWIDLGVAAEVKGDLAGAERYLLKAASVDRKLAPRQALMNFYLRRQNSAEFWKWAKDAFPMAHQDATFLFRLCRQMTTDTEAIRRVMPQTNYMRYQLLRYLMMDGLLAEAPADALDLALHTSDSADVGLLLDYCEEALHQNPESAVAVWNTLNARGLQPFRPLSPHDGAIITNGDFRRQPTGRVFDWHLQSFDGTSVTMAAAHDGISVELTGGQGLSVSLIQEWIPVEKGLRYRLEYEYTADDPGGDPNLPSGIVWQVTDLGTRTNIAQSESLRGKPGVLSARFEFLADRTACYLLALNYQRLPGTFRHEQKFTVRKISSEVVR